MSHDRRTVLSALGLALPFGLGAVRPASAAAAAPPVLGLRPFEEAVRAAFARPPRPGEEAHGRRVEVGPCDLLRTGVPGCHNARPFAGFPAGRLRIVRAGAEPGPEVGGVRLYVSTVDVVLADGAAGRPLDFATLPPAPVLAAAPPRDPPAADPRGPRRA